MSNIQAAVLIDVDPIDLRNQITLFQIKMDEASLTEIEQELATNLFDLLNQIENRVDDEAKRRQWAREDEIEQAIRDAQTLEARHERED